MTTSIGRGFLAVNKSSDGFDLNDEIYSQVHHVLLQEEKSSSFLETILSVFREISTYFSGGSEIAGKNKKALTSLLLLCYMRDCGLKEDGVFKKGIFQGEKFKAWIHDLGVGDCDLDEALIKTVHVDEKLTVGWLGCIESELVDFSRCVFFPSIGTDKEKSDILIEGIVPKGDCFFDLEYECIFEENDRRDVDTLKDRLKTELGEIIESNFEWVPEDSVAYMKNKNSSYALEVSNRYCAYEMRGERLHEKINEFFKENPGENLATLFFGKYDKFQDLRENESGVLSSIIASYVQGYSAIVSSLCVDESLDQARCDMIVKQLTARVGKKIIALYEQEQTAQQRAEFYNKLSLLHR